MNGWGEEEIATGEFCPKQDNEADSWPIMSIESMKTWVNRSMRAALTIQAA